MLRVFTAVLVVGVASLACAQGDAIAVQDASRGGEGHVRINFARSVADSRDTSLAHVATYRRHSQSAYYPVALSLVPDLGVRSTFGLQNGILGEHISHVECGSAARSMGVEPGDTIVAVNGRPITTANCWYESVRRADGGDGWLTVKIRRSGAQRLIYRTVNLARAREL